MLNKVMNKVSNPAFLLAVVLIFVAARHAEKRGLFDVIGL